MKKTWDIMLDEVYDSEELKKVCDNAKSVSYDVKKANIRFTGTQEKLNELSRAIKKYARIWGVILLWTFGAG